mmetsp:Transcript_1002/g.2166  ORF Transcript_1002/g.2166 Transcript_1002/m.2166 type:complete len:223 (-) Transcript_1002:610-1278(-)
MEGKMWERNSVRSFESYRLVVGQKEKVSEQHAIIQVWYSVATYLQCRFMDDGRRHCSAFQIQKCFVDDKDGRVLLSLRGIEGTVTKDGDLVVVTDLMDRTVTILIDHRILDDRRRTGVRDVSMITMVIKRKPCVDDTDETIKVRFDATVLDDEWIGRWTVYSQLACPFCRQFDGLLDRHVVRHTLVRVNNVDERRRVIHDVQFAMCAFFTETCMVFSPDEGG